MTGWVKFELNGLPALVNSTSHVGVLGCGRVPETTSGSTQANYCDASRELIAVNLCFR
ncbi:MAG: hypothetical protein ACI87E_003645 [Mariniblastus sp.]|jgi:hypothetical protein